MSNLQLSNDVRLTDALERELLRGAVAQQRTLDMLETLKSLSLGAVHTAGKVINFMFDVGVRMNRARANNAYYSVSQQ